MALRALNHFVPRLYLKRFSADGVRVLEYRTLAAHVQVPLWNPVAIRKLAALNHLYTAVSRDSDGLISRDDSLEQYFDREFEAPAEEAIDRAVRGETMKPEHWRRLARFYGLQQLRTPVSYLHSRNHWSSEMEGIVKLMTDLLKKAAPAGPTADILRQVEDHFREFLGIPLKIVDESQPGENKVKLRFHTSVGRSAWLEDLRRQLGPKGPIQSLENHSWTILRASPPNIFVTSDRPTANLHRDQINRWSQGGGWQEKGAVLYMPLSPSTLLFTELGARRMPRDTILAEAKVIEINRTIAGSAMRSILSIRQVPEVELFRPRRIDLHKASTENAEVANWDSTQTAGDLLL